MLSYDSPVSVNGKGPSTKTSLQTMTPSPMVVRLSAPSLPNGIRSHSASAPTAPRVEERHIWLVTGPAGCGKSTVAKYLADSLHWPYIEGDEFHPQSNVDKMTAGIPLTDADRWDWLTALREASIKQLDQGHDGVVLTCSALKRKYRDVIRVAPYFMPNVRLHFIYLDADEELLLERVMARQNHFMGANMVHSQFDILEPPKADEVDVISVDVSQPVDSVKAEALDRVLHTIHETKLGQLQK